MLKINEIKDKLKNGNKKLKIVFPEGDQENIVLVAQKLVEEKMAQPVLIYKKASEVPAKINPEIQVIIIESYDLEKMANQLVELRKNKLTIEDARPLVKEPNYFSTMLIKNNEVDCMVCGLKYSTADTLKPALQIIKTKPEFKIACSSIIMTKGEESYLFADCSLNLNPDAQQLAEIAKMNAEFAISLEVEKPQLALLSYSTLGSGHGESVEKVAKASEILNQNKQNFVYAGEIQFDTAFDSEVRNKKAPNIAITKRPDIFVFPDLNSGNIGYKIAQRMGGYEAAGPFILGLNAPVNDLSRGATLLDIYNTSIITLYQALKK
ncbi:phosphate acetyltransferase [Spiroplasma alleghenense]|uniref:Phosphate acetyltransferase n=1 Tax=Spiroplasma alleghenense TaxID=216931 RepID=A0A345Z476_9MOLU|nr:phosphate acetyltransferase [Spiroplasma alleghenense]AXK51405.1 phosphate acetyltransferase [Spiroplasma alleghenense]